MRQLLLSLLFLSHLLLPIHVFALDLSRPQTMADLVTIALENNPETKKAWWDAKRAEAAVGAARSGYFPKVDLEAKAVRGKQFAFIEGPDITYTQVGANLTLSMLLFDFGARSAEVEAAKMQLEGANWYNDWMIQKVMLQVLKNGYSVLHAQDAYRYELISLKDAEKMLEIAQELNRVGLKPITDVYSMQSLLARVKSEVAKKRAHCDIEKGKLIASLGLPVDTQLELAPLDAISSPSKEALSVLFDRAKTCRADLMQKHAALKEAYANKDKAQAGYFPKLGVTGSFGANHYLHDKTKDATYEMGLSLSMPLFSGFDTVYKNRMAKAEIHTSMEELAALELEIALEVLTYHRKVEEAEEVLDLAQNAMKTAHAAYDGVVEMYKAGKERSIADVSSALRELIEARIACSKIKSEWFVAMANLAYATGTVRTACPETNS